MAGVFPYDQQLSYGTPPGAVQGLTSTVAVPNGSSVAPPGLPPGLPPNATYSIPQRGTVPVRTVVPEVQEYQVYGQTMVPETQYVQVPVQRMVPKTIMVPETYMTTKAVTVQKPVGVVQNRQRTIQKVIEGQKIIESQQILEYERPRVQVIPGRMLGAQQMGVQQVGVQWNRAYYDQSTPVSGGVAISNAALAPSQYQAVYAPAAGVVGAQYAAPAGQQGYQVAMQPYQAAYTTAQLPISPTLGPSYGTQPGYSQAHAY